MASSSAGCARCGPPSPDPGAGALVFDTVGLAVFIGCVGLAAGPSFVSGLKSTGPGLLVVGCSWR